MPTSIESIAKSARVPRAHIVQLAQTRGFLVRRIDDTISDAVAREIQAELLAKSGGYLAEVATAADALQAAHTRLRRSDFGLDLRETVRKYATAWEALPMLEQRLKGRYVVAEVLDYFGDYNEAADRLAALGAEQKGLLQRVVDQGWSVDAADRIVIKRRIWVAIADATVWYRKGEYDKAAEVLTLCDQVVVARGAPTLFGTKARLAHARGQTCRQLAKYDDALAHFELAAAFARRRFIEKTPGAEHTSMSVISYPKATGPEFEEHRLLAHATAGKCLALGIGWIYLNRGRLSAASSSILAGYVLLRATGDVVHRAYATLLIGAVERARAGNNLQKLEPAINTMNDAVRVLGDHNTFKLHASYELLLAYYKHQKYWGDAERVLRDLRAGLDRPDQHATKRRARWTCLVSVVESRLRRMQSPRDLKIARRAAELARRAADATRIDAMIAEAEIALGEVELADKNWRGALARFDNALQHTTGNQTVLAVCHLHRAKAFRMGANLYAAQLARAEAQRWVGQVEHGFVSDLASEVDAELREAGIFYRDIDNLVVRAIQDRTVIDRGHLLDELEWEVLNRAKAQTKTPHNLFGWTKRGFTRRFRELTIRLRRQPPEDDEG